MKCLLIALIVALISLPAYSAPRSASTQSLNAAVANISSSYVGLFTAAQVVKTTKGVMFANTTTSPILVAIGAAGSEVDQVTVPASSGPTYYPMVISLGQRISVKYTGGTISSGILMSNLFYN